MNIKLYFFIFSNIILILPIDLIYKILLNMLIFCIFYKDNIEYFYPNNNIFDNKIQNNNYLENKFNNILNNKNNELDIINFNNYKLNLINYQKQLLNIQNNITNLINDMNKTIF